MNNSFRIMALCCGFSLATAMAGTNTTLILKVTANRVNLRARADREAEMVCQAAQGDLLTIGAEMQGEWYGVIPPTNADLWLSAGFVDGDTVTSRLKVRGGPSVNFSIVGIVEEGQKVTIREKRGEWLRIAPPTGCVLWIHKDLAVIQAPPARPSALPVVSAPLPPAPPVQHAPAARDPDAVNLWEGVLHPTESTPNRVAFYRLTRPDQTDPLVTVCYLKGNEEQLKSLLGKKMQIRGREYWLQQQTLPVVVPEMITLLP